MGSLAQVEGGVMKNAEQVAKELAERFSGMTFSGGLGTEWLISKIAKALQAAYQKGEEEMRERAAKVAEKRCQCPHHISIGYEIGALPLTEGGAR